MPLLLPRVALAPECVACCRRIAGLSVCAPAAAAASFQQTRGKKKNAKPVTQITVRLIKDLPGYGRKGSIVPMPIGVMRNIHFPGRTADYITMTEKKELKRSNAVIQRDFTYATVNKEEGASIKEMGHTTMQQPGRATRGKEAVRIELDQLDPREALSFLRSAIPPHVTFYRQPILANETASAEAAPDGTSIYGSVSASDVASSIKALLASTELAGRIVLADDDINFVDPETALAGRVKQLGDFQIEIKIKGLDETIKRHVRVLPVDASAADQIQEADQLMRQVAAENPIAGGEPDSKLVEIEAKLEDMDDLIKEAREAKGIPSIGGDKVYGQDGSGNSPGAAGERASTQQ